MDSYKRLLRAFEWVAVIRCIRDVRDSAEGFTMFLDSLPIVVQV